MGTLFKASRSLKTKPLSCFLASETNDPRQIVVSQKIIGNNFLEYLPLETVQIFFQNIIIFFNKMKSYFSKFFKHKKTRLYF
jgi:hypothetical protein